MYKISFIKWKITCLSKILFVKNIVLFLLFVKNIEQHVSYLIPSPEGES